MANEGSDSPDLVENEDGNIRNWSISRLISFLKSTFRPKDFAKVEAVLVARQDKSKQEIETLKQEKDLFFEKFEEERLEKMSLQDELRKCKKECEEMRSTMSKLREENMVLREREKLAEERCKNLLEEVKRIGEKDKVMIDLRSRNCELECARAKAEGEMEILRKRFEELDKRVLNLETDLPLLRDQEDSKSNGSGGPNGNLENGSVKFDETVKVEEVSVGPSSDSPVRANGHSRNAGNGRPPSQNIVEIVDIDSDDDSAPVEILSEKRMTHPAENSHLVQICVQNETPTLKRKRTSSIDVGESEIGDNDDNTLAGKLKMEKLQEAVCRPDDCPLNHCSTTTISSYSNEVNRGFATPGEGFMFSRQCEQQMESEQQSQNLMTGFPLDGLGFSEEIPVSSDSESGDDSDGVDISLDHSQLAPEAQRENIN
ncbi:uncharacterized protein LOC111291337 [Durio zibethinus]|uniref:Uncharacterized protein LOC111291337 n=1 Tax=Durio zibethinus TaxID=66656 RepID=A0A6P5YE87_DURZI|nr:uncharacterized protein LOC111291337 [Durio zibethinus]